MALARRPRGWSRSGSAGSTTTTSTRRARPRPRRSGPRSGSPTSSTGPSSIHTREAWAETFAILDDEGVPARTVFHCFTGGPDEARACLDRGAALSFSGIVTFKNADDVRAAAAITPRDRMLVETDSPYLAPVPHRGQPNRPAWVGAVGEGLAAARAESVRTVADATRANARRLFPGA